MTEWKFAQRNDAERLAHVHHFSMLKTQDDKEIEFKIRVYEYITPKDPSMPFYAVADKAVNQASMPYVPSGWGRTLLDALYQCLENIRRFPYDHGGNPEA